MTNDPKCKSKTQFSRAGLRLRELERLIKARHGIVPDTDDAELYLIPVAQCFRRILLDKGKPAAVADIVKRFGFWCETWAPHITGDHAADIVGQVLAQPKLIYDDNLGKTLRLTYADRCRLRIKTIGSFDANKAKRKALSKARRRERDQRRSEAKRRAQGSIPRADYQAQSLSHTKPWEQMGISRRTYYRRLANGAIAALGTGASPDSILVMGDGLVPLVPTEPEATTPAIAGTPQESIELVMVDGAAVGGHPDRDRRRKTRFPTAMRLNREMKAVAVERGFDLKAIDSMWEYFRNWNVGMRSYSADWTEVWEKWVDRQVDIDIEEHHRQRTRAWLAAGAPA